VTLRDTWAKLAGDSERDDAATTKAAEKAAFKAKQRQQSREGSAAEERPLTAEQQAAFERYRDRSGLAEHDARLLAATPGLGQLFDEAVAVSGRPQAVANWIVNELMRELKERHLDDVAITGPHLGELVALIDDGTISGKIGKDVFADMLASGKSPGAIVAEKGLEQVSDAAGLAPLVDDVLAANADKVAEYRAGKTALLGFFVGQVMKASRGKANPQLVNTLLREELSTETE